jgi:hypothetical protein
MLQPLPSLVLDTSFIQYGAASAAAAEDEAMRRCKCAAALVAGLDVNGMCRRGCCCRQRGIQMVQRAFLPALSSVFLELAARRVGSTPSVDEDS